MRSITLSFGSRSVPFEYDEDRFDVIGVSKESPESIGDRELGSAFERPIGSPVLEDLVEPGRSVLIAVPDGTREVGAGQVLNLLVRRLIANGTMPYEMGVIFATGTHRKVTNDEKTKILTPFITQRISVFDHDPGDLMALVKVGELPDGTPIEINRRAVEADVEVRPTP